MIASGKRRPCCYSVVPLDLYTGLNANSKAKSLWSVLTPTGKRDFIDWIESAEERESRKRRIEKACAMLASGKRRPSR